MRGNRVSNTGDAENPDATGIAAAGARCWIVENDVVSTGRAIYVAGGSGVVVEGNRVTSAGVAIELAGGSDVVVAGNQIALAETGILFLWG